jgi:SAM-dependent methyltransferase
MKRADTLSIPALGMEEGKSPEFVRVMAPARPGALEQFNHRYVVEHAPKDFLRTLEIGAGAGEHIIHEDLTPEQERHYHALELDAGRAEQIRTRFPGVQVGTGDCQQRLDFVTGDFDRIIAIRVLEFLPDLPAAVREMRRLCDPHRGVVSVVISRGGECEPMHRPREIFHELHQCFEVVHSHFFPLGIHSVALSLSIGLTMKPKPISQMRLDTMGR